MRQFGTDQGLNALTIDEIEQFNALGYLIYPNFFSPEKCRRFVRALRQLTRYSTKSKSVVPHAVFNELIFHPSILIFASSLLGEEFLFHHANGRELVGKNLSKAWHHDYDGDRGQGPYESTMIHLMGYPSGLSTDIAPLMILPGSHLVAVDRSYPRQFQMKRLPNEIRVVGEPGLLVVIDSATWHMRCRAKSKRPRPYFNLSYCKLGQPRPERATYSFILQTLRSADEQAIRLMRPEKR